MMMRSDTVSSQDAKFELQKIKPSEIWRLYIDVYRQLAPDGIEKGNLLFDEGEPGYINAMINAHHYMINTLHLPLTPQLIIDFHKAALQDVKNTSNRNPDKFRDRSVATFGLVMNEGVTNIQKSGNVSMQGLCEFLLRVQNNPEEQRIFGIVLNDLRSGGNTFDDKLLNKAMEIHRHSGVNAAAEFLRKNILTGNVEFFIDNMSHVLIQVKVSDIITMYKHKMSKAYTENEKLEAIIHLVQSLERLHPFSDGNCRTLAMLLLNRELVLNGFHPTMLDNPNRFDFFSVSELNNEIRMGFAYASKFQSEVACLPSFKALSDLLANQPNVDKLNKILSDMKDMPLAGAIKYFSSVLDDFNKGGGVAAALLGKDTKNYKCATLLLDEMKKVQDLVSNLEDTSTVKTFALMHERTKIPYSDMRKTIKSDEDAAPAANTTKPEKKVERNAGTSIDKREDNDKGRTDVKPDTHPGK